LKISGFRVVCLTIKYLKILEKSQNSEIRDPSIELAEGKTRVNFSLNLDRT
jgi:hypothetical protein